MSSRARLAAAALVVGVALAGPVAVETATPAAQTPALPDWSGVWFLEGAKPEITGFPSPSPGDAPWGPFKLMAPDAPWNAEGQARFEGLLANRGKGKGQGWGYPMMMAGSAPLQFLVTPDETLVVNSYRDLRHIYTDGRPLPAEDERWPNVWGESIGHWEGHTLVIETVSVAEPPRYFPFSPPLSANARYIERIRKTAPDRIESTMTIEDPETLTGSWTIELAYVRAELLDRLVHDDFTNDRSVLDGDVFTILPPRDQ